MISPNSNTWVTLTAEEQTTRSSKGSHLGDSSFRTSSRIAKSLNLLSQAMKRSSLTAGDSLRLTPVQVQTLLFVRHTRPDLTSIGHLAQALATTHATAVGVVDGLVRRGMLERRSKLEDRRVTLLALTPEGRTIVERLDRWNTTMERAVELLPHSSQHSLEESLGALIGVLRVGGHLTVSEPCPGCLYFQPDAAPESERPHFCDLFQRHMTVAETDFDCPKHTTKIDDLPTFPR